MRTVLIKRDRKRSLGSCPHFSFYLLLLRDNSPVPNPVYIVANKVGAIFLPFKDMCPAVDLVCNKKPIYAYLNSERSEWNSISIMREPIGEEETLLILLN